MSVALKICRMGDSLAVILPQEALEALNVGEGDSVYLTGGADAALRPNSKKPGFEEIMKIAEEGMDRYSNALRELAK